MVLFKPINQLIVPVPVETSVWPNILTSPFSLVTLVTNRLNGEAASIVHPPLSLSLFSTGHASGGTEREV